MKKMMIMASVALLVMTACGKKEKAFDATGTFEVSRGHALKALDLSQDPRSQHVQKICQILSV